ncbi:MAG: methyltransferase domain-containing protein [Pseudomonadales bacterium]|nr:methyltransferase domain-containing protein [Pseudomonadales bacterium]
MDLSAFQNKTCSEIELLKQLPLDQSVIVELGCGKADITRFIASNCTGSKVIATEVDAIQHEKNLLIDDLPNVTFLMAGAESIPAENDSVDVVFMFKSLHHVPLDKMDSALGEIRRVLKPGGVAYISEPIFSGDFNEVLRLFHDEEQVRAAAYQAIQKAVNGKLLSQIDEIEFNSPMAFESFEFFADKVVNVTHTDHKLSSELLKKIEIQFMKNMTKEGARFEMPIRINLLQKK